MGWQPKPKVQTAGFTLVELMVTLAVLAILAALAAPSLNNFTRNQRLKTVAFDLMSSINYARSEAIKRNGNVSVNATDGAWTNGWKVKFDSDDDGDIDDDDDSLREQGELSDDIDITADATTLTYQRAGRITGGANLSFTICDADGSASVPKRIIRVDTSGRPNLSQSGTCDE